MSAMVIFRKGGSGEQHVREGANVGSRPRYLRLRSSPSLSAYRFLFRPRNESDRRHPGARWTMTSQWRNRTASISHVREALIWQAHRRRRRRSSVSWPRMRNLSTRPSVSGINSTTPADSLHLISRRSALAAAVSTPVVVYVSSVPHSISTYQVRKQTSHISARCMAPTADTIQPHSWDLLTFSVWHQNPLFCYIFVFTCMHEYFIVYAFLTWRQFQYEQFLPSIFQTFS